MGTTYPGLLQLNTSQQSNEKDMKAKKLIFVQDGFEKKRIENPDEQNDLCNFFRTLY